MWYGVALGTYKTLQYGPFLYNEETNGGFTYGSNKVSWLAPIWISTTKIENPTLKSNVRMKYVLQTQCCYIATKWAQSKSCIIKRFI